ncbi:MAG: Hsp20/alpha crystallin family protein [Planctomycetota bacterium]
MFPSHTQPNQCTRSAFTPAGFAVTGRDFSDFFDRLFEPADRFRGTASASRQAPASIWEADEAFHVEVDLPGVHPDAMDLTVDDGSLIIQATRHWDDKDRKYLHQERQSGDLTRRVRLPDTIDPESITAEYANGVLHVAMTKRPEVMPRKVEVRTAD